MELDYSPELIEELREEMRQKGDGRSALITRALEEIERLKSFENAVYEQVSEHHRMAREITLLEHDRDNLSDEAIRLREALCRVEQSGTHKQSIAIARESLSTPPTRTVSH